MRFAQYIFSFLFSCFVFTSAFAQQINYKRYSIEEGLPQSEATDIVRGKYGALWVSTNSGGISRFNGTEFKTYTKEDGLADNSPTKLVFSRSEELWVFGSAGISKYDGISFQSMPNMPEEYKKAAILSAFEDKKKDNTFWILLYGKDGLKLMRFADGALQDIDWRLNDEYKKAKLYDIFQHKDGSFTVTTSKGTLDFDFENSKLERSRLYKELNVDSTLLFIPILHDQLGREWFVTKNKDRKTQFIVRENGKVRKVNFPSSPHNSYIKNVTADQEGNLWFSVMGFLVKYDGNFFRYYGKEIGIMGEAISKILIDHEGNKWIGTQGGGLIRYTDDSFLTITKQDGLPSDFVRTFHQDKEGDIWMGLTAGSLGLYDDKEVFQFDFPGACNVEVVTSIFDDPEGTTTFATNQGFYHLITGEGLRNVNHLYGLPFGVTIQDVEVENDTIWVLSKRYGFMKFYDDKMESWNSKNSNLNSFALFGFDLHDDGKIWINAESGCYVYERDGTITAKNNFATLESPAILHTTQDKYGWVNIATFGDGFLRNKGDSTQVYNTKNSNIASNIIYSVVYDYNGNVWLGTQKGISRIELDKSGNVANIINYDKYDGFRGLETNGHASFLDKEGNIWFGTIRGAVRFTPKNRRKNTSAPIVNITGVKLFYQDIDWNSDDYVAFHEGLTPWLSLPKNLELPYDKNHITFNFEGINLAVPEKLSYKWKLKGLDEEWSPVADEAKVSYPQLPSGKYTFQLMAANSEGVWNEKPAEYSFTVLAPFWRTIPFYFAMIILLTAGVFSFIKLREKALIQEKIVLEAKVRERTAEISQQNEEIMAQSEELTSQRDEIEALLDEITAQRDFVSKQHELATKANKSLTDSIRYAKRIQKAVLPPKSNLKEFIPDSFIFFQPRDIVSGDFYWFKKVDNHLIVAAADCTGHGVPGAFMSMLGVSMINELVRQKEVNQPNILLEELRVYTKQSLRQTGKAREAHDGMDVAVVALDVEANTLQYAGAHNPIYIVRSASTPLEGEGIKVGGKNGNHVLYEYKATPNPIGIHAKEQAFVNHEVKLESGDSIYLFSDGYVDQFGGKHGYKFMTKRFKKLLLENQNISMPEQEQVIQDTLMKWKGDIYDQVDDMLVIGFRIA